MTLCSHRGEMGKIFTRTEAVETEFPGGITAAQVVNISRQSPHSTWIKTNQTTPHCQSENQQANCLTSVSRMKEDTIKDTSSQQSSSAPSMKFTRDAKESPLERLVASFVTKIADEEDLVVVDEEPESQKGKKEKKVFDNWWNNSLSSCDDECQFYETDQSEDIPYWLNYELENCNPDGKTSNKTSDTGLQNAGRLSEISEHVTTFSTPDVQGLSTGKNDDRNFTKTEEKIRNLRALLAEQEKEISRLKNESKDRIFQSKEIFSSLKEDYRYPLVTSLYENEGDSSMEMDCQMITKDDNFYNEQEASAAVCKRRKRVSRTEHTSLSNTKRFRYHFRKDAPPDIKGYLHGTTEQKRTLFQDNSTFQVVKPDIRKGSLSQDEFLSFLRLVRTTNLQMKE